MRRRRCRERSYVFYSFPYSSRSPFHQFIQKNLRTSRLPTLTRSLRFTTLLRIPLLNGLPRHAKSLDTSRHTTITSRLENNLSNLLLRSSIIECAFNVRSQLCASVLTAKHRNVEEGASLKFEAWSCPDRTPARLAYILVEKLEQENRKALRRGRTSCIALAKGFCAAARDLSTYSFPATWYRILIPSL